MQNDIQAQSIMRDFACATGLSFSLQTHTLNEPRRYLWTDAFAVCNYLLFYRQSGEQLFLQQALKLVDQVHQTLGQYRKGSSHSGWLSGLNGDQAQRHPTKAGLRIGKRLDERQPDEPFNEALEWDQDGQYFHYLTKWMHALQCVSLNTGNSLYHQWALELAKAAHAAFVYTPTVGGKKRMYWKMSIDLSRPLVTSMGEHDPLDGLITYQQLQATAKQYPQIPPELTLKTEIEEMSTMCMKHNRISPDTLSIGSLLTDAYRLVQLIDIHHLHEGTRLENVLHDIELSLQAFMTHNQLSLPAEHRLAFRELGLAIGLQVINKMKQHIENHPENFDHSKSLLSLLKNLSYFHPIYNTIVNFWLEPNHQLTSTWQEHIDINSVMLATSLSPDGYLDGC